MYVFSSDIHRGTTAASTIDPFCFHDSPAETLNRIVLRSTRQRFVLPGRLHRDRLSEVTACIDSLRTELLLYSQNLIELRKTL